MDLILTNTPYNVHHSYIIETGLSHFHKMIVTVMKRNFLKTEAKFENV